jgi:hypothetical protein
VVQKNCHISDAHHASNFTLCVYLLKMREYYRWEKNYPFSISVSKEDLGSWLSEREQLWATLEEESYRPLNIGGRPMDPFATEEINRMLYSQGLVYSGGLGLGSTPHFFLAELEKRIDYQDFTVLVSAHECARDLTAPPAMAQGKTIFIRRESLQRMIWEKVQEWRWNRLENAMSRALSHYDFDNNLNQSLEQMTTHELETVILHEIGEIMAGEQLGEAWNEMLISLPRSKAEFMARAVRDHLADSLSTLPKLIDQHNTASLDFYMANLTAMRKELFPEFSEAYRLWTETHRLDALQALVERSRAHWLGVAKEMLNIYHRHGKHCMPHIESLINAHHL